LDDATKKVQVPAFQKSAATGHTQSQKAIATPINISGVPSEETSARLTVQRPNNKDGSAKYNPTKQQINAQVSSKSSSIPFKYTPGKICQQQFLATAAAGDTPSLLTNKMRLQDHYSLACHMFPRLSESNLQFHDIYWYHNAQGVISEVL
jgi:hypothetical protein